MADQPPVIAVINSTPDVVDMMRIAFEQAGFVVVSAFTYELRDGHVNLDSFAGEHDPKVVVYDIAPPYDANWQLFQHVASLPVMQGRQFVITSTNVQHVQ